MGKRTGDLNHNGKGLGTTMNYHDGAAGRNTSDTFDLFAKDARAFRAAGLGMTVINELEGHAIRAASDLLDWSASDLVRIHRVGKATAAKLTALIEMQ
jgi:hypothetical protein